MSANLHARIFQVQGDILQYKRRPKEAAVSFRKSVAAEPQGLHANRSLFAEMRALLDGGMYPECRAAGRNMQPTQSMQRAEEERSGSGRRVE